MPNDLLTIKQAAALIPAPPSTVHRWVTEGRLPAERYGNQWMLKRTDVEAFTVPTGRGWGEYHRRRKVKAWNESC